MLLNLSLNFSLLLIVSLISLCLHGSLVTQRLDRSCAQAPVSLRLLLCADRSGDGGGVEQFQTCLNFYFLIQFSLLCACLLFSSQPRMYGELSFQGSFISRLSLWKVQLDCHFPQSSPQPQASRALIFHPYFRLSLLLLLTMPQGVVFYSVQNQSSQPPLSAKLLVSFGHLYPG